VSSLFFISIRRLRAPLIFLIAAFAVSTAGFALIPGVDAEGDPWRPTMFEAFYFVTYTATTIGFGELPYTFTNVQRLWVTVIVYLSVIGWAYLLGSLLALIQDRGFQAALVTARFARSVRRLREPFYLLCGLGETGQIVAGALDRMGHRFVALDPDEGRVTHLDLGDFPTDPPALAGDVTSPETLTLAGIAKRECVGVLALTADDRSNLAIAVATRLLHPGLRTIARAHTPEAMTALETCGVAEIINPYREFAERLAIAMRAPDTHRLLAWLTGLRGGHLRPRVPAPPGHWIVCGYGRFGSEVVKALRDGGFDVTIVDPDEPPSAELEIVRGLGSDRASLVEAGIARAEGIVAGSDDDIANLAMAMAARQLRPGIFVILRQNRMRNRSLFDAFGAEMTMVPSEIVAHECLAVLRARHLSRFLGLAYARDNAWAARLTERLEPVVGPDAPDFWTAIIGRRGAPGLLDAMARPGRAPTLADLLRDPADRTRPLPAMALLLMRAGAATDGPDPATALRPGDEILFAGPSWARQAMRETLLNANTAAYVLTGRAPTSLLGRLLEHRQAAAP
jgi:Trk K+ transport system NAD-binding subunit